MAFGIFKKKEEHADVIYMNGHIYTQDAELPWATAVACKDGKILAVGDFEAMDSITDEDTEVIDLDGKYMFPGFIDAHDTYILNTFEDMYLQIDPIWDLDTVIEEVGDYAEGIDDGQVVFGYGYNEHALADYDEDELTKFIDEVCLDKAVILLGASGAHVMMNSVAKSIVMTVAEDAGLELEVIPPHFALDVLNPIDFEEAEYAVKNTVETMTDKGFTAHLSLMVPDFFENIFQNMLITLIGEDFDIKQRLHGSFFLNRCLNPRYVCKKLEAGRTNCMELDGMINYNTLKIEMIEDEELAYFTEEQLYETCELAASKNFDIHIDAADQESYDKAKNVLVKLREKNYNKSNFVIASDFDEDLSEYGIVSTWQTGYLNESVFSHSSSIKEAIWHLTLGAAEILGISDCNGSIEKGKNADFTVFEENPFDKDLRYFSRMHSEMIIVDGLCVYDVEAENEMEMYNMMMGIQM